MHVIRNGFFKAFGRNEIPMFNRVYNYITLQKDLLPLFVSSYTILLCEVLANGLYNS